MMKKNVNGLSFIFNILFNNKIIIINYLLIPYYLFQQALRQASKLKPPLWAGGPGKLGKPTDWPTAAGTEL